jgi:Zn-dependent protease/cell wall assembly regulator SMI1
MLDLFTLILGIALVILVLQLRAVLSRPFPIVRLRLVAASAPAGVADLYADAQAQMIELGFEGPLWVLNDTEPSDMNLVPLQAVYRHPQQRAAVWLGAPVDAASPHRLLSYLTTALNDGRLLVTQAFDPYFSALADDKLLAQCVAAESLREQWALHQKWVVARSGGIEARDVDEAAILSIGELASNAHRARLLDRGLLDVGENGLARPGFSLAFRMLWHYWRRPKSRMAPAPIPVLRLAMLARVVDMTRQREPTRRTQWLLFLISSVLFAILGAVFWDLRIAIVLLAVVAFHELGHFVAMRVFGYRQVHMLALPLIGGVTMGVDADPSATKRAWMSLMGPLPGIVVGWLLLVWQIQAPPSSAVAAEWLTTTIWVSLFVNYLNVLPVPPLDGGHVVQAMLPPRWINVQTVFVLIACALGAVAAWVFDFKLLVLLAALQFIGAFQQFAVGRAVKSLLPEETSFRLRPRLMRISRALSALETSAGATSIALSRINQALQVVQVIETRPMGWGQRLLIGAVFSGLLVVPVLGLVVALVYSSIIGGVVNDPMVEAQESERVALVREAETHDTARLLADIEPLEEETAAASAEAIAAAESRIGKALPGALREIYLQRNGVEYLSIDRVESIDIASRRNASSLELMSDQGKLLVWAVSPQLEATENEADEEEYVPPEEVPLERAGNWIDIGSAEMDGGGLYLDIGTEGEARVISCYETCDAYAGLRAWLNQQWVSVRQMHSMNARMQQARAQAMKSLADASVPELLAQFEAPSLLMRWIGDIDMRPGAADAEEIRQAEQRLGRSLPKDLLDLYAEHDGFPALRLLPVSAIQPYQPETPPADADTTATEVTADQLPAWSGIALEHCLVIGGSPISSDDGGYALRAQQQTALLWCPNSHRADIEVVDLLQRQVYASIMDYIRSRAADDIARRQVNEYQIGADGTE